MNIKVIYNEDDFLQFHLFIASRDANIIKARKSKRMLFLSLGFLFAYINGLNQNFKLAIFFLLLGVITFFVYPKYFANYYIKHYKKYVVNNYQFLLSSHNFFDFKENCLLLNDTLTESKIDYKIFSEIYETGNYFYLKYKTPHYLIVPKRDIYDMNEFSMIINLLMEINQITKNVDLNWKWK